MSALLAQRIEPQRSYVPAEWIGRARALRQRILTAATEAEAIAEVLLQPLRPRDRFIPIPTHKRLAKTARIWERERPDFGRFNLICDYERGRLHIVELALTHGTIAADAAGWEEPAIALMLRKIEIRPPQYDERTFTLACIGLHALARRYQRGQSRDDDAVLHDLRPLAAAAPRAFRRGGEFEIPVSSGGRWIGGVIPQHKTVFVRTFLP